MRLYFTITTLVVDSVNLNDMTLLLSFQGEAETLIRGYRRYLTDTYKLNKKKRKRTRHIPRSNSILVIRF